MIVHLGLLINGLGVIDYIVVAFQFSLILYLGGYGIVACEATPSPALFV